MKRSTLLGCMAMAAAACAGDEEAGPDASAIVTDVGLLDTSPDLGRDTTELELPENEVPLPRGPEPIRVIVKVHLEDLVKYTDSARARNFADYFDFVDETVAKVAAELGAPLSIHGNGDWWELAAQDPDLVARVRTWKAAGHELAPHVHSVYKDDADGAWKDIPLANRRDGAWIDESWQDCIEDRTHFEAVGLEGLAAELDAP